MKGFPAGEWLTYDYGTSREHGDDWEQHAVGQASMLRVEGLERGAGEKEIPGEA